jgi:hypothetical protein
MAESVSFVPVADDVADAVASVRAVVADPRLSRSNFFDGRLLTAQDLIREQVYLDGRLREVGRALGHGVALGLVPRLEGTRRSVSPGVAITPAGRTLVVDATHPLSVELGNRARLRELNDGLYDRLPGGLYVIALAAAEATRGLAEVFPTDLSARRVTRPDIVVEGVELLLVRIDLPIPRGAAVHARAQLAPTLAGMRPRGLGDDQVPLGLIAVDNDRVAWLDARLCRHALRLDAGTDTTTSALADHWDSLALDIAAYRVSSGQPPVYAANEYLRLLPPLGKLPKAAIDPVAGTHQFFPAHWDVRLAPLRNDDWPALRAEALAQEPLDLSSSAPASVLVLALVDPSVFGTYAQALEVPRPGRAFPSLDALRLRLAPKTAPNSNPLDTDAETWKQLWPLVPEGGVMFVRRRALAADGGVSALILARGTTVPSAPPPASPPPEPPPATPADAFAAVEAARVDTDTAASAGDVSKLLERSPELRDPVSRAFLLLGPRFDRALWPTLLELLKPEDDAASNLEQLVANLQKFKAEEEPLLRERLAKLSSKLGASEETAKLWTEKVEG